MAGTTLPGVLLTGTHAARPAATAVGTGAVYSCTTHSLIYQSDGTAWGTWATFIASVSGGDHGTLTGLSDDDHPQYATNTEFDDHNARHETGGADAIKLDDLAAPDDNTDLNVLTTKHGLAPKLSNVATEYLSGTGVYSTPSGSGIPATIVDAKGDSIWATAADTVARLAVGTNGYVPMAASGESTGVLWAKRELDYVEKTTATSVTATTEATANTVVTGSAITYDGATAVVIEFYCNYFEVPASVNVRLFLYDDTGGSAASIGALAVVTPPASLFRQPVHVLRRLTPSAAEHAYSIRAQTDSGTASVNAGAGGSGNAMPAFIRITRAL